MESLVDELRRLRIQLERMTYNVSNVLRDR